MNVLVIYGRDIDQDDSGASRTMILTSNYLASTDGFFVYTNFRHLSPIDSRITEIPCDLTVENIKRIVLDKKIDIIASLGDEETAFKAVQGTGCKIVSQFHSKPGYECLNLINSIINGGQMSCKNRLKSYVKIAFFPLYKFYIRRKARTNFQNASLLADKLVVLSESFIGEYKVAYCLPNAKNIVAIGNPLSFDTFADKEQIERKDKTILVVSRLDETAKRISIVIKAWAKLEKQYPDWNVEIVGSGESEQAYRKMIAKLGLKNITLCGRQNPESYYEKASIFLMTSAYEGWGMTLTEALQKGCVSVAMNSYSALGYIINDGQDGFVTPNNDIDAFVDKIQYLIENREQRVKMALSGIENCKRFSVDNIGQQWVALYNEVLKS